MMVLHVETPTPTCLPCAEDLGPKENPQAHRGGVLKVDDL